MIGTGLIEKKSLPRRNPRRKPGLADSLSPQLVRKLASQGISLEQIARYTGCTKPNVAYAIRTDKALNAAWNEGALELYDLATNALRQKIVNGDTIAILFCLKSRFGWVEEQYKKQVDLDLVPKVQIFLPSNSRENELKDLEE